MKAEIYLAGASSVRPGRGALGTFVNPDNLILNQALALLLLVLLSPVMLVVACLIWRRDGAPIFFAHHRVGNDSKMFRCMKFRTVLRDAEPVLAALLASSLDELPRPRPGRREEVVVVLQAQSTTDAVGAGLFHGPRTPLCQHAAGHGAQHSDGGAAYCMSCGWTCGGTCEMSKRRRTGCRSGAVPNAGIAPVKPQRSAGALHRQTARWPPGAMGRCSRPRPGPSFRSRTWRCSMRWATHGSACGRHGA